MTDANFTASAEIVAPPARQYATADQYRRIVSGAPTKQYDDEQLNYYLQVATANVESYCERVFSQGIYNETFRGDGSTTFLVYEYPIFTVRSLVGSTIADSPTVTTLDVTKLILDDRNKASGRIELSGLDEVSAFSPSSLYTLLYIGGFATIPVSVRHATCLWTAELLRPDYAGVRSDAPEIIPMTSEQITELLQPLRRRRLG